MPEENNCSSELQECMEVFSMIFISHYQAAEVVQPSKESFDLPPLAVAAKPVLQQVIR